VNIDLRARIRKRKSISAPRIIMFIVLALCLLPAPCCYCQDSQENPPSENKKIMSISGRAAQVEFAEEFIVVSNEAGSGYVTISVPDNTTISRGKESIGLDDIDPNDYLTVQYYIPKPGATYVAVSIVDSAPSNQ
jgi:hypothetical protein